MPYKTGTGFLYFDVETIESDGSRSGRVYVVTARHLLEGFPPEGITTISVNTASGSLEGIMRGTYPVSDWDMHDEADVAILPVPFADLKEQGATADLVLTSESIVTKSNAYSVGAYEGARILIVGFPVGWRPAHQDYSITRDGVIGEMRGWMSGAHDTILVSGAVYPGNSGSPVVLDTVSPTSDEGMGSWCLVGMATSRTLSPLANDPSVSENADVTQVVPMETVAELIHNTKQEQFIV